MRPRWSASRTTATLRLPSPCAIGRATRSAPHRLRIFKEAGGGRPTGRYIDYFYSSLGVARRAQGANARRQVSPGGLRHDAARHVDAAGCRRVMVDLFSGVAHYHSLFIRYTFVIRSGGAPTRHPAQDRDGLTTRSIRKGTHTPDTLVHTRTELN